MTTTLSILAKCSQTASYVLSFAQYNNNISTSRLVQLLETEYRYVSSMAVQSFERK